MEVSTLHPLATTHYNTVNLTQQAIDGKISTQFLAVIEVRKAIDILCRKRQNNPIMVGEPAWVKPLLSKA